MEGKAKTPTQEGTPDVQRMIDELVKNANEALAEYLQMDRSRWTMRCMR